MSDNSLLTSSSIKIASKFLLILASQLVGSDCTPCVLCELTVVPVDDAIVVRILFGSSDDVNAFTRVLMEGSVLLPDGMRWGSL